MQDPSPPAAAVRRKRHFFRLAPGPNGTWHESVAYSFQGPPDAAFAYNGMVGDPAGNFYGTTVHGGTSDEGAVYEFTP